MLYQTIQENSYDNNGEPKPTGIQVGLGVKNTAITSMFTKELYLKQIMNLILPLMEEVSLWFKPAMEVLLILEMVLSALPMEPRINFGGF